MTGSTDLGPRWTGSTAISWRVLLDATVTDPVGADVLAARWRALHEAQEWGEPPNVLDADAPEAVVTAALTVDQPEPVLLAASARRLRLAAHHRHVDGLGLLRILALLADTSAASSARGVGDRTMAGGPGRAITQRLWESLRRPPAPVNPPRAVDESAGAASGSVTRPDSLATRVVPGTWRTADLVDAATRAVTEHQRRLGGRHHHVAIAVGASRGAPAGPIGDRSVLMRLTDVDRLERAEIADLLRRAPLQPPPQLRGPAGLVSLADRLAGPAQRVLGPRLGSTVLVSHLGDVTAPGVELLAFHPVTAGGSGLALGAVGLTGHTALTLRARGDAWRADDLAALLAEVVAHL